jgi:hypothetical protein
MTAIGHITANSGVALVVYVAEDGAIVLASESERSRTFHHFDVGRAKELVSLLMRGTWATAKGR